MKVYRLNEKEYASESELRDALPNKSFPRLTKQNEQAVCALLGVEIIERPVEVPELTPERKAALAKRVRDMAVSAIVVEVDGMVFDGNEESQSRMVRMIRSMEELNEPSCQWVLHDNSVATVTLAQLKMASSMAMKKQSELWVVPYGGNDV